MKDLSLIDDFINNESNFIPLFSIDDEENFRKTAVPDEIALLPLRNTLLFPGMVIPINVGRTKSIKLAQDYSRSNTPIGVIAQRDNDVEEPTASDLYRVGTMARIIKYITMPDGGVTIIVQGIKCFVLKEITQTEPYYKGLTEPFETNENDPALVDATAWAIDLRMGKNGEKFVLDPSSAISVTVFMKAPETLESDSIDPIAYNNIYLLNSVKFGKDSE